MPEGVVKKDGRYEVDPKLMKKVDKSVIKDMTTEAVEKVVAMRNEYMGWMHNNFAKNTLKPPSKEKDGND
jgi:DNA-binding protein YbaB